MFLLAFGLLFTFTGLLHTALGADINGAIEWNEYCPDVSSLGSAVVALEDGRHYSTGVTNDGQFVLRDVPEGHYVLSIKALHHTFDHVLVRVSSDDSAPQVAPYLAGTPMSSASSQIRLPYPISLTARRQNNYFVPREGFNLVGMFSNPMMLMMAFAGIMVFAMPYLLKNMDPEAAKEIEERRANITGLQSTLQNMDVGKSLADLMGGKERVDDMKEKERDPTPRKSGSNRSKNAKTKRR